MQKLTQGPKENRRFLHMWNLSFLFVSAFTFISLRVSYFDCFWFPVLGNFVSPTALSSCLLTPSDSLDCQSQVMFLAFGPIVIYVGYYFFILITQQSIWND